MPLEPLVESLLDELEAAHCTCGACDAGGKYTKEQKLAMNSWEKCGIHDRVARLKRLISRSSFSEEYEMWKRVLAHPLAAELLASPAVQERLRDFICPEAVLPHESAPCR